MNATPSHSEGASRWVCLQRLGLHHFAHLRAVAEGMEVIEAAKRYLGIEHGHQAHWAHQQTRDAVRAVARRRGLAWRLIGLNLGTTPAPSGIQPPRLDDFIAANGLEGWAESEVLQMHQEIYPGDAAVLRRAGVRSRLRRRQLALLKELENLAAERPLPSDPITDWFDPLTSHRLLQAGLRSLEDLQSRIHTGGRWWSSLPGIGRIKAQRIAAHLTLLWPASVSRPTVHFAIANKHQTRVTPIDPKLEWPNPSQATDQRSDQEAIQAWIAARAGSTATVKVYHREAQRLLLWLQHERHGMGLKDLRLLDCRDYMAFLQNIPTHWMSKAKAAPGTMGWAPFRGRLSTSSIRQAIGVVASMFQWLQAIGHIDSNPWLLVNQKIADDRTQRMLQSKALSEALMNRLIDCCRRQLPQAGAQRMLFIVQFLTSVGLRSAELLAARLQDLQQEEEGWVMQVHGKGAKNRIVAIPASALAALTNYLRARGLGDIAQADPQTPLLASLDDPRRGIGYQALYEHVKSWMRKALKTHHDATPGAAAEQARLQRASTHWLRHTFGTMAIAKNVPLDVIQAQMGHASIQTTTAIYGRAPIRRHVDELQRAFG